MPTIAIFKIKLLIHFWVRSYISFIIYEYR